MGQTLFVNISIRNTHNSKRLQDKDL